VYQPRAPEDDAFSQGCLSLGAPIGLGWFDVPSPHSFDGLAQQAARPFMLIQDKQILAPSTQPGLERLQTP